MNQVYYKKKIRMLQKRVHELEALLNQEPEPETAQAPEKSIPGMAPKKDKAKKGK